MRPLRLLPLLLPALLGCGGRPDSPFVRVMADDGRVYYAEWPKALKSNTGGFLTFRDLVTGEQVHLTDGSYVAKMCPRQEVMVRQDEYLNDPTRVPRIEDYPEEAPP